MASLFTNKIDLQLPDCAISYLPAFLSHKEADGYFNLLKKSVPWRQDDIMVFGKMHPQPRLTALYASNAKPYRYSNITMVPQTFSPPLLELKEKIESEAEVMFTTCLLNLYRDGRDSNGWHADDEKELGRNPVIASLSLGQERRFHLKHKTSGLKHKMVLSHGSLLLMQGSTQHHWLHQVPKTSRKVGPRINLTFRIIR